MKFETVPEDGRRGLPPMDPDNGRAYEMPQTEVHKSGRFDLVRQCDQCGSVTVVTGRLFEGLHQVMFGATLEPDELKELRAMWEATR